MTVQLIFLESVEAITPTTTMRPTLPLFASLVGAQQSILANSDSTEAPYTCEHPLYTPQIISTSPLIIYLHNFTTPSERAHLRAKTSVPFLSAPSSLPYN